MERVLLFSSVLLGVLVWGVSAWLPPLRLAAAAAAPPPEEGGRPAAGSFWRMPLAWAAILLPVVGFLLTLPAGGKLFSSGQDLGRGFLLGGIAALLAARFPGRRAASAVDPGAVGLAAAAAALAVLFLRGGIVDALAGVALGWFAAAFPLYLAARGAAGEGEAAARLAAGAGFAAAVCGAALFGIWRDDLTPALAKTTWAAAALAFAALSALVVLVLRAAAPASSRAALVPALGYFVVAGGMMKLLAVKAVPEPRLFWAAAAGLIVWPVAEWLVRDSRARDSSRNPASPIGGLPPLAVLLVAGGFLAAFQLLRGVGASVYVLALWLSAAASGALRTGGASERRTEPATVALLLFSTLLLLGRLVAARWSDDLRDTVTVDQYGLFGIVVGAVTPGLIASLVGRRPSAGAGAGGVLSLVLAGTLALGIPAVVVLLFGGKSAAALLLGLALGGAMSFRWGPAPSESEAESLLPGLAALACTLGFAQFLGRLLPLTEMTRLHKVQLLGVLVAGTIVALLAAELATRGRTAAAGGKSEAK